MTPIILDTNVILRYLLFRFHAPAARLPMRRWSFGARQKFEEFRATGEVKS
ncbi:hypothetical protein [Lamprobacter sp.]|uniref:hypothetical protein n=1 Tax=Lamprobacter sp. TaxID=3100796 RepID=UPI002B25BB64|nr:hypothetical protein [Lamprobacter sp.]